MCAYDFAFGVVCGKIMARAGTLDFLTEKDRVIRLTFVRFFALELPRFKTAKIRKRLFEKAH